MKQMSQRQERISDQIREELGKFIARGDFNDPRLSRLITIPYVWVSPDLKHARVFFNSLKKEDNLSSLSEALNGERHRFQRALAHLPSKFTPILKFYADDVADRTNRIEELLQKNKTA